MSASQSPPPGWCSITDNSNYDHNMNLQYSWEVAGYPGHWYEWGNSIVGHSPTLPATSYTFDSVDSMPFDAHSQGWDPLDGSTARPRYAARRAS